MNVVVGGGITGLWLARQLAMKGQPVTLVTRDRSGGLLASNTVRVDGMSFRADLGGHVYTAQDERVTTLLESVGGVKHSRKAFYHDERWGDIPYPVQDSAQMIGMSIEPDRSAWKWYEGMSLQDWAIKRFGDIFYDRWFKPFNSRVWTMTPDKLDSDWVAGRVKTGPPDPKWGPNSDFLYAPGDLIIARLFQDIEELGVKVMIGNATMTNSGFMVDGTYLLYDTMFWTAPIYQLVGGHDLKVNYVATLAVVLEDVPHTEFNWHWRYCDVHNDVHRVTNLSAYHPLIGPPEHSLMLLELPHAQGARPGFTRLAYKTMLEGSAQAGMVDPDVTSLWLRSAGLEEYEWDAKAARMFKFVGYPIPTIGLRRRMANTKAHLAKRRIFVAGRWGDHAYFNIEHCMSSADSAILAATYGADHDYLLSTHYYGAYR